MYIQTMHNRLHKMETDIYSNEGLTFGGWFNVLSTNNQI